MVVDLELIDEPPMVAVEEASWIWRQAESLRVTSVPYDSYLEDQRRGFLDSVSRSDAWLTVAVCDSKAIGLVGGLGPSADQPALYVGYVAVEVSHRRQGHGNRLLQHASARAAQLGASSLVLTVHETNRAARSLYELVGWSPTGRHEATPIDQELLIEYELTLPPK